MHKEYKAKTRLVFSLKIRRGLPVSEVELSLPE